MAPDFEGLVSRCGSVTIVLLQTKVAVKTCYKFQSTYGHTVGKNVSSTAKAKQIVLLS